MRAVNTLPLTSPEVPPPISVHDEFPNEKVINVGGHSLVAPAFGLCFAMLFKITMAIGTVPMTLNDEARRALHIYLKITKFRHFYPTRVVSQSNAIEAQFAYSLEFVKLAH